MFTKVLFPTDFSEESRQAMDCILKLKPNGLKEVVVLHVNDLRGIDKLEPFVISSQFLKIRTKVIKETQTALQAIEQELKGQGIDVKLYLRNGFPVEEILKVEDEEDVSAVVMGSHDWSDLHRMFTGSLAEAVVHRSKRPVIVVKHKM